MSMKQGLGCVVLSSVSKSTQGFSMLSPLAPPRQLKSEGGGGNLSFGKIDRSPNAILSPIPRQ